MHYDSNRQLITNDVSVEKIVAMAAATKHLSTMTAVAYSGGNVAAIQYA